MAARGGEPKGGTSRSLETAVTFSQRTAAGLGAGVIVGLFLGDRAGVRRRLKARAYPSQSTDSERGY